MPALGLGQGSALRPAPLDARHCRHEPVREPGRKFDAARGLELARRQPRLDRVRLVLERLDEVCRRARTAPGRADAPDIRGPGRSAPFTFGERHVPQQPGEAALREPEGGRGEGRGHGEAPLEGGVEL